MCSAGLASRGRDRVDDYDRDRSDRDRSSRTGPPPPFDGSTSANSVAGGGGRDTGLPSSGVRDSYSREYPPSQPSYRTPQAAPSQQEQQEQRRHSVRRDRHETHESNRGNEPRHMDDRGRAGDRNERDSVRCIDVGRDRMAVDRRERDSDRLAGDRRQRDSDRLAGERRERDSDSDRARDGGRDRLAGDSNYNRRSVTDDGYNGSKSRADRHGRHRDAGRDRDGDEDGGRGLKRRRPPVSSVRVHILVYRTSSCLATRRCNVCFTKRILLITSCAPARR